MPASSRPCTPGPDNPALFTLEADGRISSWGTAAARLFGRPARQVLGRPVRDLLAGDDPALMTEALAAIAAGEAWAGVLAVSAADGPDSRIEACLEPLTLADSRSQVAVAARRLAPAGRELVSEAGMRLGASLDLAEIAREILDITVPRLADGGGVYVLERLLSADEPTGRQSGGQLVVRRVAVSMVHGDRRERDDTFPDGEVLAFDDTTPYARCLSGGDPVLFDRPDSESMARLASRPSGTEIIARYASFLAVPLAARDTAAGFMVFARTATALPFGINDVALAGELAAQAAVFIDNARLLHRERRTAEALQQGLLPSDLAAPAGLEVAHRYLPAGDHIVGGDWYDIIPLSGGRAALVVGDAMGHGPEAAAVMVQLRAAARTLADLDLAPEAVLYRLDRMASTLKNATFATCVYAVVDPAAGSCALARAGHLPPILAFPDTTTRIPSLPPGLPLGLGSATFHTIQLTLPPGTTLALYTDGLVESRRRPFDEGILALRSALSRMRGTLHDTCDSITRALRQHGEDDTTLVLARIPASPLP